MTELSEYLESIKTTSLSRASVKSFLNAVEKSVPEINKKARMPKSGNWGKFGGNRHIHRDNIYLHIWLNEDSKYISQDFKNHMTEGINGVYGEHISSVVRSGEFKEGHVIDLTPPISLDRSVDALNHVFDKLKNLELNIQDIEIYTMKGGVDRIFRWYNSSEFRLFIPVREVRNVPYLLETDSLAKDRYKGIVFPK